MPALIKEIIAPLLGTTALALFVMGGAAPNRAPIHEHPKAPPLQLSGEKAQHYLEETLDGRSLLQAVMAAQFGLKAQERSPFDEQSGAGYLGMSHDQNLNAWFAEDGMTVRPTVPAKERDEAWQLGFRLKALGYGMELAEAPPIVRQIVNGHRVEYHRGALFSPQPSSLNSQPLIEWYENRPEGIEQGFTLNERPVRSGAKVAWASSPCPIGKMPMPRSAASDTFEHTEPLRVLLAVEGDLRAELTDGGQSIVMSRGNGKPALSYSKLVAVDAKGQQLAARMEASADGRQIALVVEDQDAAYPIVIDPIMASLEKKLEAFFGRQADARFGFAVAIDRNRAVVGAWREDSGSLADTGVVYAFSRSGNSWTLVSTNDGGFFANDVCGQSVAINGTSIVYGCPGAESSSGRAYFRVFGSSGNATPILPQSGFLSAGDRFGESVALDGDNIAVGAPYYGAQDIGANLIFGIFRIDSSVYYRGFITGDNSPANQLLGSSVGIDGDTVISGAPGAGAGYVKVHRIEDFVRLKAVLKSNDGEAGDQFGNSLDISGNTMVVGAFGDDDRGTDSGAAYVFVRDASGVWSQQQKLTVSDGRKDDHFSEHAVAIQGNTIVVGATGRDLEVSGDNAGAAYLFTRSGTVWSLQTALEGKAAENFGIAVDISGDTVLIGARAADAGGTARAGAAYVYRLDCVPPYDSQAFVFNFQSLIYTSYTACPGERTRLFVGAQTATRFQWRKNGVNIPGATANSYDINSVGASDTGSYDAFISNACGGEFSRPATLSVLTFSLSPTSGNFGVSGSNGVVSVTATGSTCSWTAVSNSSFITVNSGSSGTGNGTVGFTVAANPNSGQRTGSITIAGITFNVSQDGTNCSYSIAPTSQNLGASASTNTVNVTAGAGCAWTATSNDPSFLSINSGASGSGNGTVTYTIATNFDTAQRIGTLTIAGQIFTVTQDGMPTPTPTPTPAGTPATLGNISTRLSVETGDNVLIGGFIVTGTQDKKVIIRAIGPSLGLADKLANPTLELRNSAGALLQENDDWMNSPNQQAIIDSTIPPTNDLESAIVATLPANSSAYTAIVRGANNSTGIGVVEIYDLDRTVDSKLANISTRGLVQTGDTVLIAGTIVLGQSSQKVIIRAIGPSLSIGGMSIGGKLGDPTLELRDANGGLIRANDNWRIGGQEAEIIASTVPPTNDFESAIVETLLGNGASYTAIVRGVNDSTGIAVVEVYALD